MKTSLSNRSARYLVLAILAMLVPTLLRTVSVRAEQVVIESMNDGEIDEHGNWNNYTKASPTGCYLNACKFMYAGRLADDYGSPVVGPSKFSVMKFDVSSLAGQTINSATLRLIQTFDPDASVTNERTLDSTIRGGMVMAPTTDVYAVNLGAEDFDEALSTWNSFTEGLPSPTDATRNAFLTSGKISLLGSMTNVVNPGGISGAGAPVTFSDTDLTSLVQGWIDGAVPNLGLVLLNPTTFSGAPQAPGDTMARYATHESQESLNGGSPDFGGTVLPWDPPQLIISFGAGLPGDYNSDNSVDAADYTVWRDNPAGFGGPDGYNTWRSNFGTMAAAGTGSAVTFPGTVPEPSTLLLALVATTGLAGQFLSRRRSNRIS